MNPYKYIHGFKSRDFWPHCEPRREISRAFLINNDLEKASKLAFMVASVINRVIFWLDQFTTMPTMKYLSGHRYQSDPNQLLSCYLAGSQPYFGSHNICWFNGCLDKYHGLVESVTANYFLPKIFVSMCFWCDFIWVSFILFMIRYISYVPINSKLINTNDHGILSKFWFEKQM